MLTHVKEIKDEVQRLSAIQNLILSLPTENKVTYDWSIVTFPKKLLYKLVIFFAIITTHSDTNGMDSLEISQSVVTELMYPEKGDPTDEELDQMVDIIQALIEHHDVIFWITQGCLL